ncbi:hypothetical protein [Streptococcus sp. HF-1907]|nr:hypothetical protein [Streptococcus sp. HF-1907]
MSKSSKSLNAFHLNIVAIIAMFINHIGHTLNMSTTHLSEILSIWPSVY